MSWMVKIENVSKMYRLGLVGSATIQDDLKRMWYKWRGKEDPFLKIGEENKRDALGGDYVWALKDIDLEVNQGEVLGIIGKNGAGKSTLLKLLSKVTKPSTGSIKTKGRIASLLEVGTGFHPELTGRENIFLNGAILGMKKYEIKSKFDEIVDFSGCERYIDTPVKRYSSGMYVRLAFAVAAHLDPEILVVDEVLAVGDVEFQKKAIGKMKNVSEGQGRTVLFVSHNMNSIKKLCDKVVLMQKGLITNKQTVEEGISLYLNSNKITNRNIQYNLLESISLINELNKVTNTVRIGEKITFSLVMSNKSIQNLVFRIQILDYLGNITTTLSNYHSSKPFDANPKSTVKCTIPKTPFVKGKYIISVRVLSNYELIEEHENCLDFTVLDGDFYGTNLTPNVSQGCMIEHNWIIEDDIT